MLEWHNAELDFNDTPDGVSVYLVGTAKIKPGKLQIELGVKFTRLSETIKIALRTKEHKVWPEHQVYDIEEGMLAEKYASWITKFHRTNNSFRSVALKSAARAESGAVTWILALVDIIKKGD